MILSDASILAQRKNKTIVIKPFNKECLGSNSYDCHLSKHIAIYASDEDVELAEQGLIHLYNKYSTSGRIGITLGELLREITKATVLDAKRHNKVIHFKIPSEGIALYPEGFYLGSTIEYTETHTHVPFIEGKSSIGRLGIDIHATAGKGDVGFCGHWTLEISVKQPVKVYAGMPIAQLIYFPVVGEVINAYNKKKGAKYSGQHGKPVESMMWKNKF